jgi:hypothetical protein
MMPLKTTNLRKREATTMKRHLVPCLVGLAAAVAVLVLLGGDAGTVGFIAVALLCPLMMLVMMGTMMRGAHGSGRHDSGASSPADTRSDEGVRR